MERSKREDITISGADLKNFYLGCEAEDFISVVKWSNGEGHTISINNELGARTFELSIEEFNAIKYLMDKLEYEPYKEEE